MNKSPFQRFTTQKTRLNSTLTSNHVISGKLNVIFSRSITISPGSRLSPIWLR